MASPTHCMLFLICLHFLVSLFFHSCFAVPVNPSDASQVLVTQVCKQTQDVDFCIASLDSDPRAATADLNGLASISLELSFFTAIDTNALIAESLKNATDPGLKQVLDHCTINYNGAVYALDKMTENLDANNIKAAAELTGIASSNARDCERVFAEGPTQYRSLLTSRNGKLVKLTDTSDVITGLVLRSM